MPAVDLILPMFPESHAGKGAFPEPARETTEVHAILPGYPELLEKLEARLQDFERLQQQRPDLEQLIFQDESLTFRTNCSRGGQPEAESLGQEESGGVLTQIAVRALQAGEAQLGSRKALSQLKTAEGYQRLELKVERERLRWQGKQLILGEETISTFKTGYIGPGDLLLARLAQASSRQIGPLFQRFSQFFPERALRVARQGLWIGGRFRDEPYCPIAQHLDRQDFTPLLHSPHEEIRRAALRLVGQKNEQRRKR